MSAALDVLTDDELLAAYNDGTDEDQAAALEEAARRDRAARASSAARQRFAEWEDAARANFAAAEFFCRGDDNMLNERGRRRKVTGWDLWFGSEERARELASDDLIRFWDYHQPRPPAPRDYVAAERDAMAEARARTEDEGEAPMTTREDVARYRAEAPPEVMEAARESVAAIQARNLAEIRTAAGLDASGAPAGLRAPEGRAVAVAQPESGVQPRAGGSLERAQPPREPVDGAALLTNVCKWLKRYLYLDSEAKYWALTLWVAGTHFRDEAGALVHDTYPIAGFLSDEPGSGKTHALECLSVLCPAAPSILTEPSEAAIIRLIGKHHRTILLDEGDILFGSGKRKAAIRAIFNSGYKKRGTWPRASKNDVEEVPTAGAKAIAALSVVKTGTGTAMDALMSRIVEWEMHKPPAGTVIHKMRERFGTGIHGGPVTGLTIGAHLNGQMAAWAAQERDALAATVMELPEGVELREEEKWGPLLGVGARAEANRQDREDEAAREDGQNWADLGWQACMDMSLYGGVPDTAEAEAATVAGIIDGWE